MLGENLMEGAWFWKAPIIHIQYMAISTGLHEYSIAGDDKCCDIV